MTLLPGVDLSSFQGPPADWREAAGNISWAAIKITELNVHGPYVNPDAAADWAFLGQQGKGRIGYMFAHPGLSAASSVRLFLAEIRKLGLEDADGVALDLEVTDGLSPSSVAAWSAEVMALLQRETHRSPVLYSFLSFAEEGNCAGLGRYPLWIADPSSPRGKPRVPPPWSTWAIHQHSISGGIDRDVARFPSAAAMGKALGKGRPPVAKPAITADGKKTLYQLASAEGMGSAHLLRLQAGPRQPFSREMAAYVNQVFAESQVPVPEGTELTLERRDA